ncbi:MAG: cohesin domain-containing protein [Clostridiales bacterium]|nr:cohesin domain-containing protein [Clostridiales bacterium]
MSLCKKKIGVMLTLLLGVFLIFGTPAVADDAFVPVSDIIDVPYKATVGVPLTLYGTVLPGDASSKSITWSIKDAGATGATIAGNMLNTSRSGTVVVTATVENGLEGNDMAALAAGENHSVVLKKDGSLWAWGWNRGGQFGNSTNIDSNVPVRVGTGDDWAQFAANTAITVAIKKDNSLWAWGLTGYSQLEDGPAIRSNTPIQIENDKNWATISAGYMFNVAIKTDGSMWAWGNNTYGQLGDGTTTWRYVPVRIGMNNDWAALAAGTSYTVALKKDGSLWAWGLNHHGQLGDGTNEDSTVPVRVGTDNNWVTVAVGLFHTLALKTDGSLWGWGWNFNGQLGDSSRKSYNEPYRIGADYDWAQITAGGDHSLAIKRDGSLWGWGANYYGQLGDGSGFDWVVPFRIGKDNDWSAVRTGFEHTLGLKKDGSLWAWGSNIYGQVGDGTTGYANNRYSPVRIGTDNDWGKGTTFTKDFAISVAEATIAKYNYMVSLVSAQNIVKAGETFCVDVMLAGDTNYALAETKIAYDTSLLEYTGYENVGGWMNQIQREKPNVITIRNVAAINMNTGASCKTPVKLITLKFKVAGTLPDYAVQTDLTFASIAVFSAAGVAGASIAPSEPLIITLHK